jgi:hypothetical protein
MVCSEGNDAAVAAVVAAAAAAAVMTDPDGVGVAMGSKKDAIMNSIRGPIDFHSRAHRV